MALSTKAKKSATKSAAKSNKQTVSPAVKEARDILALCYQFSRPYFDLANKDVEAYNQIIDPATWTTMSEMTTGGAMRLVQNTLPNLLFNVLWAPEYPFTLIPQDSSIDLKQSMQLSRKTREWLIYNLRDRMKIDLKGFFTALDGVKIGIGYGAIEPTVQYMAERTSTTVERDGKRITIRGLDVAEPKIVTSYRHIPFGSILPAPDGVMPNETSALNWIDTIDEIRFRAMCENNENITCNPTEVIAYAKANGYDANTFTIRSIIAKLAGREHDSISKYDPARRNCKGITLIPIHKLLRQNKHIWIACDKFKIFESEDTVETLESSVLKYSFSPDGGCWFTRGVIGPNLDLLRNSETWENAMLDLFSLHLHPHKVVNMEMLQEEGSHEDLQPYGTTYVRGEPSRAYAFVTPPVLPAIISDIGSRLRAMADDNAALSSSVGRQSPGMVRGGSQALETILQSTTDREKMLAKHLENTWYDPLIRLTLVHLAVFTEGDESFVIERTENEPGNKNKRKVGDNYHEVITMTNDDLSYVWRVSIDFRDKLKNFLTESAHRLQVYDRLIQDPDVNTEELKYYLVGDEAQVRKFLTGVDRGKRMEDIKTMMAMKQNTATMSPGAPGGGPAVGGGAPAAGAEMAPEVTGV